MKLPEGIRDEDLKLFLDFLSIPTTNDNLEAQLKGAHFLKSRLEDLGFNVELLPIKPKGLKLQGRSPIRFSDEDSERYIVYAYPEGMNPSELPLVIYGHYDVVPAMGWEEAFSPKLLEEEGDIRVYARGANDMKGGIFAGLLAVGEYKSKYGRLPKVKFILVTDEEEWSKGAWSIVYHYKEILEGAKLVIVPEIGDGSAEAGSEGLLIGRRGRVVFDLRIKGIPYHGAKPIEGVNPVLRLRAAIDTLSDLQLGYDPRMGIYDSLAILSLETPSYQLTIPEEVRLRVDLHYTSEFLRKLAFEGAELSSGYEERLVKWLEWRLYPKVDGLEIKLMDRPTPFPPLWMENPEKVREILGDIPKRYNLIVSVGSSVADENVLATLKAEYPELIIVDLCPVGRGSHSVGEWISLNSLVRIRDILLEIF